MLFQTIFSATFLFAASAFAAPAQELETRDLQTLYLCTDINWSGTCNNFASYTGQCVNLPSGFSGLISSAGPQAGTACELYEDDSCKSNTSLYLTYPGSANLVDNGFNDRVRSFTCYSVPS